jgi:hypothetical protein
MVQGHPRRVWGDSPSVWSLVDHPVSGDDPTKVKVVLVTGATLEIAGKHVGRDVARDDPNLVVDVSIGPSNGPSFPVLSGLAMRAEPLTVNDDRVIAAVLYALVQVYFLMVGDFLIGSANSMTADVHGQVEGVVVNRPGLMFQLLGVQLFPTSALPESGGQGASSP